MDISTYTEQELELYIRDFAKRVVNKVSVEESQAMLEQLMMERERRNCDLDQLAIRLDLPEQPESNIFIEPTMVDIDNPTEPVPKIYHPQGLTVVSPTNPPPQAPHMAISPEPVYSPEEKDETAETYFDEEIAYDESESTEIFDEYPARRQEKWRRSPKKKSSTPIIIIISALSLFILVFGLGTIILIARYMSNDESEPVVADAAIEKEELPLPKPNIQDRRSKINNNFSNQNTRKPVIKKPKEAIVKVKSVKKLDIQLISAIYGDATNPKKQTNINSKIKSKLDRREYEFVISNDFAGSDPVPGRQKVLLLKYKQDGKTITQTINENSKVSFSEHPPIQKPVVKKPDPVVKDPVLTTSPNFNAILKTKEFTITPNNPKASFISKNQIKPGSLYSPVKDFTLVVQFKTTHDGTGFAEKSGDGVICCWADKEGFWTEETTSNRALIIKNGTVHFDVNWKGSIRGRTPVNDNKWHIVVLRYRKGKMEIYLDGKSEVSGKVFTDFPEHPTFFMINANTDVHIKHFNGSINRVKFFNGYIEPSQIASKPLLNWPEN
jgi:hypothetical protein